MSECNNSFIGMTNNNSNKKYNDLRYVLLIMLKLIITCIKILPLVEQLLGPWIS